MGLADLTSREAVISAVNEYDELGRDAFLTKYGYRPARDYVVTFEGREYDSKAIAGVAFGRQFPDHGPLKSDQFQGGEMTVKPVLERLGFSVTRLSASSQITSEDVELIRASRVHSRYSDLPDDQKGAYRRVHIALEALGKVVLDMLTPLGKFTLRTTSGFTPASGVRGALPKDLWFSVSPASSELGMPQLFMIVSTRGVEYGFAPTIHPSDFSNQDIRQRVRDATPRIFSALPTADSQEAHALEDALDVTGPWLFQRKVRLEPASGDFPSLSAWLAYLASSEGARWGSGAISQHLSPEELSNPDLNLTDRMRKFAHAFAPLMQHMEHTMQSSAEVIRLEIEELLVQLPPFRTAKPFGQHDALKVRMNKIQRHLAGLPAVRARPNVHVSWSLGAGNWAKVPWIALMDDRETDSTQRGTYAVFLFPEDMSGVFLTLNQGVTDTISAQGRAEGRRALSDKADKFRQRVDSLETAGFSLDGRIDLKTDGNLGKDYESSTIAYKFYPRGSVPSDHAINADISSLLDAYDKILSQPPVKSGLNDVLEEEDEDPAPPDIHVWMYAPGRNAEFWDDFYEQGIMAIGWDEIGDLSQFGSPEEIASALQSEYPSDRHPRNDARACYDFAQTMKEGDLVFVKRGRSTIIGHGVIEGPYQWMDERGQYKNIRQVRWEIRGEWQSPEQLAMKTLTDITRFPELVAQLKDLVAATPPEATPPVAREPYTVANAMEDLFMPRDEFERALRVWHAKRNLILQGAPGVGKSFIARRIAYSLMGYRDPSRVRSVQFHQSYSYEDFVQGYRPDGNRGFELKSGVFVDFCRKAMKDRDETYVFIIDEINRGNLSRIFGELMLLIEPDKRSPDWAVKLAYARSGEERFYVPPNVYILGLMNTADRSLSLVDYALRRRFGFVTLTPQYETQRFRDALSAAQISPDTIDRIVQRMSALNEEIASDRANLGPSFCIGHSFFVPSSPVPAAADNWYEEIVATEILPLLEEYWIDEADKVDRWRDQLLK